MIVGLVLYALSQNINLFFSPSDMAQGKAPAHQRIRAGGMVRAGSLVRDSDSLSVRFLITDSPCHECAVSLLLSVKSLRLLFTYWVECRFGSIL